MGNRIQTIDDVGSIFTYGYDRAYQLVNESPAGEIGWSDMTLSQWADMTLDQWSRMTLVLPRATYIYDPLGNRKTLIRPDQTRITYSYDSANQMTRFIDTGVVTTLVYDAAGNPLQQRNATQPFNVTMTWDAESRLSTYHQAGVASGNSFDQSLTHIYDGDGKRVERQGTPGNVRFVRDGNSIHLKLNLSNALLDSYVYEPSDYGLLIASAGPLYPLYDTLGSTANLTDSSGNIKDGYIYSSWGEASTLDGTSVAIYPFLFVGRQGYYSDDEGIDKNHTSPLLPFQVGARFYQPMWGRWLNRDPSKSEWNFYRYVFNNPIGLIDPSGLIETGPGITGGIAANPISVLRSEYDAERDAKLKQQLQKCCSNFTGLDARAKTKDCLAQIDSIIAGLQKARNNIYQNGGPARFSYFGSVCTKCEQEVSTALPIGSGGLDAIFDYHTITHGAAGSFGHVWGEIICNATGDTITIDFWAGGRDYWCAGKDKYGYKRD